MLTANHYIMKIRYYFLPICFLIAGWGTGNAQVSFSMPGGFYQHSFDLTLSAGEGCSIHYTLDGSTPTLLSPVYGQPLTLSPALYSTRDIFLMRDSPEREWNPPSSVRHAIVVRAAAFDSQGHRQGGVTTHTYLIADLLGREAQLPVVSISLDYEALFDPDTGIFSPTGWTPDDNYNTGNFNQHGQEWERVANIEYHEPGNSGFSQRAGLRVHGGNSRIIMQKSLKLYARKEYGPKHFVYPLFDEVPYSSFKRLVLRPFCSAWTPAGIQDLLALRIARPLQFVSMASRPVSLFINGEYWGIYFLQESPDERLVAQVDDVDADDVDIIGSWSGLVEHGSNSRFLSLFRMIDTADFSDSLQYASLCELVDMDNYIDYLLLEAFAANVDWPSNNMRMYQHDSSPWRWLLYDGDACFISPDIRMDEILTYEGEDTWPSNREATLLFRRLQHSPLFQERFRQRLQEITSSVFGYARTGAILSEIRSAVEPEIRWQCERFLIPVDSTQWDSALAVVDYFLRQRPSVFLSQMESLGISIVEEEPTFLLYPNPTHGRVTLRLSDVDRGTTHVLVYDMKGRMVLEQPLSVTENTREVSLSVGHLPAGVYLVRLSSSPKAVRMGVVN